MFSTDFKVIVIKRYWNVEMKWKKWNVILKCRLGAKLGLNMKAIIFIIFANTWGVHKCDFLLSSFLSGAKYDESCQGSWRRELVSPTSKVPIRPGGIHDNRPTVKGDIMPYYSGVYPAWPLESSKTPRKLWHTWGSLYVPVYKVRLFKCPVILMKVKDNHFQCKRTAPKLSFQYPHTYIMYWLLAFRDFKTESAFF